MLNLQDFKDKGYSISNTAETSIFEKDWASKLIQKKFWNDNGTKYFINVYMTEYDKWSCINRMPESYRGKISYTIKIQLYKGMHVYNISVTNDEEWESVDEIEKIVEDLWVNMGMDMDHHN